MIGRVASGEELRALMRRYPAGVSVLTVRVESGSYGATIGSLVSLSLEPALVGVSVGRATALHELVREARTFGVSVLSSDQEVLASRFSRAVPPIGLWEGVAARPGLFGAPLLEDALGWLECRLWAEYAAGDHTLFVGEVEGVELGRTGRPLVYVDGRYRAS